MQKFSLQTPLQVTRSGDLFTKLATEFGNNLFLSSLLLSFKYHFSHYLVIPMNYDNTTVVEISGHSVDSHMIPSLKNTVLIKCIFSCASNDIKRKK